MEKETNHQVLQTIDCTLVLQRLIRGRPDAQCLAFMGKVLIGAATDSIVTLNGVTVKCILLRLSMAETKCARWRRKSVPVWLINKRGEAHDVV